MTVKKMIEYQNIVLDHKNIKENDLPNIGGKAKQLETLQKLGFAVPKWVVIPTIAFDQIFLEKEENFKKIILDQLSNRFSKDSRFAVRSSAIQEDGIHHSFAGQFETKLNISFEELWSAIKAVRDSATSETVQKYCLENQISEKPTMAIIIQEMLEPEVAGVAFGINPATGNRNEKVVSSVYGLGEGLVSGELDGDTFIIGDQIESTIATKTHCRKRMEHEGTKLFLVPKPQQNIASLNQKQIYQIVNVLDKLKRHYGKSQDIEFAYVDDKLFLLQTRPITGLNNLADKSGQYILWDNSNIVESYPGVTSPLTFSFIRKIYDAAYAQLLQLLGVSNKKIKANESTLANLLGLLKGRVYYNLPNWYKLLALLPGFSLNARFMETMMGVKERFDLPEYKKTGKLKASFQVTISILKMIWQLISLPKKSKEFHKLLDHTIDHYRQIDFDTCRSEELMKHYFELEEILLKRWKAPLVNDLFAMIFFGLFQKLCKKHLPDHPNIHNGLIADSGDIISTQPAKQLLAIATSIQRNEEVRDLFLTKDSKAIWRQLQKNKFPQTGQEIRNYIEKFGDRCTGELKLETITYRQNPEALIHILKSYVSQGIKEKDRNGSASKSTAEAIIAQNFKGNWVSKRLFYFVLQKARQLVSGRENLRFERTRAFAVVRDIFTALGRNWYSEGILEQPRDIFYLSQQEIFDYIQGTSINDKPAELIKLRKQSFQNFEKVAAPSERIATFSIVNHGNNFYQEANETILKGDLQGIGCSPGRVKGKVQVIHHPSEIDSLEGDILVTTSTDPGWVALFPTASAILVERGSLLSHSAIVAREMGIPCIVGIKHLLKKLKTGDVIEMDGSTGELKVES